MLFIVVYLLFSFTGIFTKGGPERAAVKAKVVQLRRSSDLRNIDIYVDECSIPEKAADVNSMNQQNIQPIIQTPSGLVPVITRSYVNQYNQQFSQPQEYQYVHYQTSELIQEPYDQGLHAEYILNPSSVISSTVPNDYYGTNLRTENGTHEVVLNSKAELSAYIQQPEGEHVVIQEQDHRPYSLLEHTNFQTYIQPQVQTHHQTLQQLQYTQQPHHT